MEVFENRAEWYENYKQGWLAHYEQTGETNFKLYERPRNSTAPQGKAIDLSKNRLILISSAGGYLPPEQIAFDAENVLGTYDIRMIPSDTKLDKLAFAHTHYDHTAVNADTQVLVPLRHLEAMVREGLIGEMAPDFISFMGYQPDVTRVLDETIPLIIEAVKSQQVDGALLVPS